MENSTPLGKDLRSRIGKLATAIGFAFVIGSVGVGPALAGGGRHDRGGGHDGGGDRGRQQEPRHEERHDYGRHEYVPPPTYYAPAPDYYAPPNYYYAPPPTYYEEPPPPPSEGWTFIFPLGR